MTTLAAYVFNLCSRAVSFTLDVFERFMAATGLLPYFLAMFFICAGVAFLLLPITGHSDLGRRELPTNSVNTPRLTDGSDKFKSSGRKGRSSGKRGRN